MPHCRAAFRVVTLAGLAALLLNASGAPSRAQPTAAAPGQAPTKGTLRYYSLPAPALRASVYHTPARQPAAVYLPPSYDTSDRRYPVVYFLPGFGDAIQMYTDWRFYQGFALPEAMDRLIADGAAPEMIVVMPNGMNFLGGCFYVNSPLTGNWEDYFVKELVGEIDRRFRTLPAAASRGISGHSMGGTGALMLAMRHPDVFGAVYALSPGLAAPGGLATHLMFDSLSAAQVLAENAVLDSLPDVDARTAFMSYIHLQNMTFNLGPLFAYAYGAAFAPNVTGKAPFIEYPMRRGEKGLVVEPSVWQRYEAGFGDLDTKVAQYKSNLGKLRYVAIDVGTKDEHVWIPAGCRYFAKLLRDERIPIELVEFDGAHQDRLGERLTGMLPALSKHLAF